MAERPLSCFYCDAPLTASTRERDHFPLPERHGGAQTVNVCRTCHDVKDRLTFDRWPAEWVAEIAGDMPHLSRGTRLFLGRAFALVADMVTERAASAELRMLTMRLLEEAADLDDANAPGHDHQVPGVWDPDNEPGIAGQPCTKCRDWRRLTELLRGR